VILICVVGAVILIKTLWQSRSEAK